MRRRRLMVGALGALAAILAVAWPYEPVTYLATAAVVVIVVFDIDRKGVAR